MRERADTMFRVVYAETRYQRGNVRATLFPGRFGERYRKKMEHAQFVLDEIIKHDTEPYVPYKTGNLANTVNLNRSGSGMITWSGAQARYLYHGKLMVYEPTGSTRAPAGEKKVVAKPERQLVYDRTTHPLAGAYWYDRAYKEHHKDWAKAAKQAFKEG